MRSATLTLLTLCSLLMSVAAAFAAERIEIGNVSDVNLEAVRQLIRNVEVDQAVPTDLETVRLTLEESLKVALENNLDLQIQTLARDALVPEIAATKAKFHPTPGLAWLYTNDLSVDRLPAGAAADPLSRQRTQAFSPGVFLRQELPTGGSFTISADAIRTTNDRANEHFWDNSAGIEFRQPLMRGGRIFVARREITDAEYDLEIETARLDTAILGVTANTKQAYYLNQVGKHVIQATEQAVQRSRNLIESSTALFEAGRGGKRDVVSAEIQLSGDLARLANEQGRLQRRQNDLRNVLGLPVSTRVELAETELPFEPIAFDIGNWIELALVHRPELRQIGTQLEKQELAIRVRENDVLPKLDLFGSFRARTPNNNTKFSQGWDLDQNNLAAGVEFEVPFGNVAARSRLTSARIDQRRLERQYVNQERQIELEVRNAAIVLETNLQQVKPLMDGVEQARDKFEIASVRFQLGLANNLDITDAQTDLLDAEIALLESIADYAIALAFLEAAVGTTL